MTPSLVPSDCWRVPADGSTTFEIELPYAQESAPEWNVTIGGAPATWVSTVIRRTRAFVTFTIPSHATADLYPLSLTFSTPTSAKRYVVRHTLEIVPAAPVSPLRRLQRQVGWRWVAFGGVALIAAFLLLRWVVTPSVLVESAYDRQSDDGALASIEPLALLPVEIQTQWQEALPLPDMLPTPTLIPSPTPLPPMPTPLPPPPTPPVVEARGLALETVHGEYTYERMFQEVGDQFGVDWRLLASIAYRESGLTPDAVGGSGEEGMMQIMPDTWGQFAPRVGETDPFNPYASTRVAAYYLTYLRDYLYSQGYTEPYWLLVAYNWGPNNLRQHLAGGGDWGGIPAMRQNYAYSIIDIVNNEQSVLWSSEVKVAVP